MNKKQKLSFEFTVAKGKANSKQGKFNIPATGEVYQVAKVTCEQIVKVLNGTDDKFTQLAKNICFDDYDRNFDCLLQDKKDIKDNALFVEVHEAFQRVAKNQKTGFKKLIQAPVEMRQIALQTYCAKQKSASKISIQELVKCLPNEENAKREPKVSANKLCKDRLTLAHQNKDWSKIYDLLIDLDVKVEV